MQSVISTPAAIDIAEAAQYLLEQNQEAAVRFTYAVEASIKTIETTPKIGAEIRDDGLRMWFVRGFEKYVIIYKIVNEQIKIVRIIHAARDYKRIFKI